MGRSMSTERKRILTVGLESGLTRLFKLVLERTGRYEIHGEADPTQAEDAATDFNPDLILMNIIMPKIDGVDLAQQFRTSSRFSHIPIIFITALITKAVKEIGGFPALAQPVTMEELKEAIEAQLPPDDQSAVFR